jgi:Polyketide cyclase / dehydrase and lipid transport
MRIDNDITIARRPEQVWAILGDLSAVTRWVPGVSSARMEGMRRICELEEGGEIHEKIIGLSNERRRYSYDQVVHPLGFRRSRGMLAVDANGDGSRVNWNAEVDFVDGIQEAQVLPMLRKGYAAALQRLKHLAEG